MPHKKNLPMPTWVDRLDDRCLETAVVEALVARRSAIRQGAERSGPACRAALRAGDATLERIADGSIKGELAWKRAADALRKYTTAAECAMPTAMRRGHLIGRT
jgi:hypothetical protein